MPVKKTVTKKQPKNARVVRSRRLISRYRQRFYPSYMVLENRSLKLLMDKVNEILKESCLNKQSTYLCGKPEYRNGKYIVIIENMIPIERTR